MRTPAIEEGAVLVARVDGVSPAAASSVRDGLGASAILEEPQDTYLGQGDHLHLKTKV